MWQEEYVVWLVKEGILHASADCNAQREVSFALNGMREEINQMKTNAKDIMEKFHVLGLVFGTVFFLLLAVIVLK